MRGRVREQKDLAVRLFNRRVLSGSLAEPFFLAMQADTTVRKTTHDLVGPIGRAVRRDEDFQFLLRIVEGERVFELMSQIALFVVGRDDDGHWWRKLAAPHRLSSKFAEKHQQQRIASVRVRDSYHGDPEDDLDEKPHLSH